MKTKQTPHLLPRFYEMMPKEIKEEAISPAERRSLQVLVGIAALGVLALVGEKYDTHEHNEAAAIASAQQISSRIVEGISITPRAGADAAKDPNPNVYLLNPHTYVNVHNGTPLQHATEVAGHKITPDSTTLEIQYTTFADKHLRDPRASTRIDPSNPEIESLGKNPDDLMTIVLDEDASPGEYVGKIVAIGSAEIDRTDDSIYTAATAEQYEGTITFDVDEHGAYLGSLF